jgi:carbonic anhydrase/acetyltransferase-like protein (isoleucine patch superfamily)
MPAWPHRIDGAGRRPRRTCFGKEALSWLVEHQGRRPEVDASAWIAPTAVLCGEVVVGPRCQIGSGAVLVAEGGPITLGREVIVRDHAAVRASARHPVAIGNHVLVGPGACLFGCTVEDEVFLATRVIRRRAEVRVNAVVHVRSTVAEGATVPISWVAVGDPASFFPPAAHEQIWALQEPRDFPRTAYGMERLPGGGVDMVELTGRLAAASVGHREDRIVE